MAMHACQIGPTDTAPPCPASSLLACVGTKGSSDLKLCSPVNLVSFRSFVTMYEFRGSFEMTLVQSSQEATEYSAHVCSNQKLHMNSFSSSNWSKRGHRRNHKNYYGQNEKI